jgi:hypothetical protein
MGKKNRKRRREDLVDGLEEEDASTGRSTRGPPVATTSGWLSGSVPNDEWQTTRRTWEGIAQRFAAWKSKRIWMPFYYDGVCAVHLRSLGFKNVIHTQQDFFERVEDKAFMATVDLIWDNPPYTNADIKERVLRALVASGKPYAMLLPISILHVGFVRDIVDTDAVQCIVPRRVWVRKHDGEELPFKYLVWLCSHTNLPRDLLFVDD